MIKKICCTLLNIVSIAAILVAVVALLTVVFTPAGQAPSIGGYSVLRVLTGSMEPTISTNSLILVEKLSPDAVQPGDVISFYSADPQLHGALNTHRVVSVETAASGYVFTTRGDANTLPDPYPVTQAALVGRVIGSSAWLGSAVAFLANPLAFVLLILAPLLSMTIYNLYKVIHSAREVMKVEEQAAIAQALADAKKKREDQAAALSGPPAGPPPN